MKKRLIALILLSSFIGCEKNNSSITIQNEQNMSRIQEPASNHTVMDREAIIEHIYQTITPGRSSHGTIIVEPDYWVDKHLGLRFAPPADMSVVNRERKRKGLIVIFTNGVGHTIGILDATVAYPDITWSDINQKLSDMKDCGDGFYEKIIAGTTKKSPIVQLLRCVGNGERIYLIQAYAPRKAYSKVVQQFKASMKSLSFD
ncbi:hypothetical protein ACFL5Z_14725 [Planctomycetota bacterium]